MSAKISDASAVSSCEKVSLQTEYLSKLVCPVCYEYMKPPIFACENNHGICELCDELMSNCPVCNKNLTHRRSSQLEVLTALILFPCKQCQKKFSLDELQLHRCNFEIENPQVVCLIGQVYGRCNWRGHSREMLDHISEEHPNNYWTKMENLAKWNYCHLSNIGIQQVYVLDIAEAIFVIVQKYDSHSRALQWNVSCESEKASSGYIYEIQLYSDNNLQTLKCKNDVENGDNILMSLPSKSDIAIPLEKVEQFLGDNDYVFYKVIVHPKNYVRNDNSVNCDQEFCQVTDADGDLNETKDKDSCTQKTWHTIVDFYSYVKRRLSC